MHTFTIGDGSHCFLTNKKIKTRWGLLKMHCVHRRREIPNLKSSIGVHIGQKQKCLKKVSPLSSSCQNTNLHPNCCEWSSWFTNSVFITNKNSILGYDISGFSSTNELCDTNLLSKLRCRSISIWFPDWCLFDVPNLFSKSGTYILMLDPWFQIGYIVLLLHLYPIWGNFIRVRY